MEVTNYLLFQFFSKDCIALGYDEGSHSGLNILMRILLCLFSPLELISILREGDLEECLECFDG